MSRTKKINIFDIVLKKFNDDNSLFQDMELSDVEIKQLEKKGLTFDYLDNYSEGGDVITKQGWDYKKEGDKVLTKKVESTDWIEAKGSPLKAINADIYSEDNKNNITPSDNNTTVVNSKPSININDKEYVKSIQQKLVDNGYDLGKYGSNKNGVDGVYGSITKNALDGYNKGLAPNKIAAIKPVSKNNPVYNEKASTTLSDGYMPEFKEGHEVCQQGKMCSFNTSAKLGTLLGGIVEGGSGALWAENAWFNRDKQLSNGGKLIYSTDNRGSAEEMPVLPKNMYSKLQIGDYVHLNRSGSTYDSDPGEYKNEKLEHVGFIVGKDKDGTPLVWHGSEKGTAYIQRIDGVISLPDHAIPGVLPQGLTYQIGSVVRNKSLVNIDQEKLKKLQETNYYSKYDASKKLEATKSSTETQTEAIKYVNALGPTFKSTLGYAQNDINMVGQLLVGGIMQMESDGNESSYRYVKQAGAYAIKDAAGFLKKFKGDQASWGVYQMKDDYNFKNKDGSLNGLGNKLNNAGVHPDDIMDNVKNQTAAGMVILLDNYNKLKKDPKFDVKTGLYNKKVPASYILAKSWQAGSGWQDREKYEAFLDNLDITYSDKAVNHASNNVTVTKGPTISSQNELIKKQQHALDQKATAKRNAKRAAWLKTEQGKKWTVSQEKIKADNLKRNASSVYFQNSNESTRVNVAPKNLPVVKNRFFKDGGQVKEMELTELEIKKYISLGYTIEDIN